jgi:hypothetical protein
MKYLMLIVAVVIATTSCDKDSPASPGGTASIEGVYVGGFEESFLTPCGSGETWWVQPTMPFGGRYTALGLP